MNVKALDDIVYIYLKQQKVDLKHSRSHPIRDNLDISSSEYIDFLSTFNFFNQYIRTFLNNVVFKQGIQFPYNPDQLYTTVGFKEGSMHVFLDINKDAHRILEESFWYDKKKN